MRISLRFRQPGRPSAQGGFTIAEAMLASSIAMVMMFGGLYSTSEIFEVVREGDRRVHTHIHARRSLERILRDCRYASDLEVTGSIETGWFLDVVTTGTLDPGAVTYSWNPNTKQLRARNDTLDDLVIPEVVSMNILTEMVPVGSSSEIGRITLEWTVNVQSGFEAGLGAKSYQVSMAGSTWVRRHVPDF